MKLKVYLTEESETELFANILRPKINQAYEELYEYIEKGIKAIDGVTNFKFNEDTFGQKTLSFKFRGYTVKGEMSRTGYSIHLNMYHPASHEAQKDAHNANSLGDVEQQPSPLKNHLATLPASQSIKTLKASLEKAIKKLGGPRK